RACRDTGAPPACWCPERRRPLWRTPRWRKEKLFFACLDSNLWPLPHNAGGLVMKWNAQLARRRRPSRPIAKVGQAGLAQGRHQVGKVAENATCVPRINDFFDHKGFRTANRRGELA